MHAAPKMIRIGPPIDYWFDIGCQSYALEHTVVEAFDRQIPMGIYFSDMVGPIVLALSQEMPIPGIYYLTFPLDTCSELKPKHLKAVREKIIEWVKAAAQELHAEAPIKTTRDYMPHGYTGNTTVRLAGVPFELTLTRRVHWAISDSRDGRLFVQRNAPDDLTNLRQVRMKMAFDKKLPKLSECRTLGASSILVLENNDVALTNHILVAEAIESILSEYSSEMQPDEIFLVDSSIDDAWTVSSLLRTGHLLLDEHLELHPADLDEV